MSRAEPGHVIDLSLSVPHEVKRGYDEHDPSPLLSATCSYLVIDTRSRSAGCLAVSAICRPGHGDVKSIGVVRRREAPIFVVAAGDIANDARKAPSPPIPEIKARGHGS